MSFDLEEGAQGQILLHEKIPIEVSNLTTSDSIDSKPMISGRLASHAKHLGPIIREIKAFFKSATYSTLALSGWR